VFDRLADAERVKTRAFLGLQLEQFQQAHSRAADNPSPPAPSSAKIRRSLSPGISGTPAPARVRPAADSAETTHLLAPSPRKEASARTGLNASQSPGHPGRQSPTLRHGRAVSSSRRHAHGLQTATPAVLPVARARSEVISGSTR
jgi:hypothetical protein